MWNNGNVALCKACVPRLLCVGDASSIVVLTPVIISFFHVQDLQLWKWNRFEAYKPNTTDTARLSLARGVNGAAATMLMLETIDEDKKRVAHLCGQQCVKLWLEAASVCEMTFMCPSTPGRRLPIRKLSDIGLAWQQDPGRITCKQIAFVFDFYGTEVYRRAFSTTHQEMTFALVMDRLGVQMDVLPSEMEHGQKTCVQQLYSCTANWRKNNVLRQGKHLHGARVCLTQGATRTSLNWRRPKDVFFIMRPNNGDRKNQLIEKVSSSVQTPFHRMPSIL